MATSSTTYDVIIIGCGPAGIAAALELQKHQPTPHYLILEARDRVGGRAYTDTLTLDTEEPIDLGARWIHHFRPENPLSVHHTPSDKDKTSHQFFVPKETVFFDDDGSPLPEHVVVQADKFVQELYEDIKEYSADEDISISQLIHQKYRTIQDDQLRRVIDMKLAYTEYYEASSLDQLSVKSYSKSDYNIPTCDLSTTTGLGSLVQRIARQHNLIIQLNTIVTTIDIPQDHNDPIRISTGDNRLYLARCVLMTVPLGCLKARTIQFNPSLPDWKQNAIDKMGLGLLNKVFIQFPRTFWNEKLEAIHIASNRFRFFLCFPHDRMLALGVANDLARELEQQTDEETIEQIIQSLRVIYPQMPTPIKWVISRWGQDPFARGSYSNFQVGASYETTEELARECYDGRLYWAGEHANYGGTIGCVDSAFESGHREAKRICQKTKSFNS